MPATEPFIQLPLHLRPLPLPVFIPTAPVTFSKPAICNAEHSSDLWHPEPYLLVSRDLLYPASKFLLLPRFLGL